MSASPLCELAPARGWAFVVIMVSHSGTPTGCMSTTRLMMGHRQTTTKEEAIGHFVRDCLVSNEGFAVLEVMALEIAAE